MPAQRHRSIPGCNSEPTITGVTAYDSVYVALAEGLDCPLLTADRRLSTAAGIGCDVQVVRRA